MMQIRPHSADDYATAIQSLLPPGAAWRWPTNGVGHAMLLGTGQELARVEAETQQVLDRAVEIHRPRAANWHISTYRAVANNAVADVVETIPRKPIRVGSRVGERLWRADAVFPVPLVQVDHLFGPLRVGSRVGDRVWGTRSRYVLRVRYYRSVVNPKALWRALNEFKQSHVFLWFEDITGIGGEVSYAQD
ncbi:hypothetical protein ACH518_09690 [Methylomonas sp. HW2-6]|uniref:hypothetical protein n=1 Tax=Methylomonas sp. HW2-6 TaxID=3376687 RepID=UPI0040435D48